MEAEQDEEKTLLLQLENVRDFLFRFIRLYKN